MQLLLDIEGAVVGTFVREPDGAQLLYYSQQLWNDGINALRHSHDEFVAVFFADREIKPDRIPEEAIALAPGEFIRYHGALESQPLRKVSNIHLDSCGCGGSCGCACDSDCQCR